MGEEVAADMRGRFAFRGGAPANLFLLLMSLLFFAPPILRGHAQSMASATRSDEFDTADRQGGQVGGTMMGVGYRLMAMRCASGEVMAGANIRRGDALENIQIICATPSCASGACMWSAPHRGMSAGNPNGGEALPAIMCPSSEIVSGIRGRVVVFAERSGFDYAADIELECSQMTSSAVTGPAGHGFYPVTQGGSGSLRHTASNYTPERPTSRDSMTRVISCRPGGYGATAISVGVAHFLGLPGQPVVQAVSLYCPRIAPTVPQLPPPSIASTVRKQKPGRTGNPPQRLQDGITVTGPKSDKSGMAVTGPPQLPQQIGFAPSPTDFRLMTPEDPMWANRDYAGTLGYFPGKSNARSNCHGFIGEMGVATPGANLCGDAFMQSLPHLPAGTPHQLGDVAIAFDRFTKAPFHWHSAFFVGCDLYLQRNSGSDIQVIKQGYLDSLTANEQVSYVRPIGLGTFPAKLAGLKAEINPGDGTTAGHQTVIAQIKGCFPN